MKSFIKNIILFVPFALTLYIIIVIAVGELNIGILKKNLTYFVGSYGHTHTRLKEVKSINHIDLLFLGSSHAYRGFDTRIYNEYGYRCFNLGSSRQSPIQTELLLKRYLKVLSPKIVIYEVCPMTFSTDGVESSCDIISNDIVDMNLIKTCIEQNNIKIYNTLIYSLYRQISGREKNFKEPTEKDGDTYIQGGFEEKKLLFNSPKKIEIQKKTELNQAQMKHFESIVKLVKNSGAKLILIQAPVTTSNYECYLNNHEFDKTMQQYATYYNMNEMISLDDSLDFYDAHHLNKNGVEKFNRFFIETLKR